MTKPKDFPGEELACRGSGLVPAGGFIRRCRACGKPVGITLTGKASRHLPPETSVTPTPPAP